MLARAHAWPLAGALLAIPAAVHAQQPLIDAGQQAMIQHYNNLIEQQSAPDQEEQAQRARNARGRPSTADDERCDTDAMRESLRPEYERRVEEQGREAATTWLREKATELGRYARANC